MISGNAFSCCDLTWMKWISTPSITVVNCGSAFSLASHLRQSYSLVQYRASSCSVASCTPCDRSATSSLVGQRAAATRWCRSSICDSGTSTWNGRMSVVASTVVLMTPPSGSPFVRSAGVGDTTSFRLWPAPRTREMHWSRWSRAARGLGDTGRMLARRALVLAVMAEVGMDPVALDDYLADFEEGCRGS